MARWIAGVSGIPVGAGFRRRVGNRGWLSVNELPSCCGSTLSPVIPAAESYATEASSRGRKARALRQVVCFTFRQSAFDTRWCRGGADSSALGISTHRAVAGTSAAHAAVSATVPESPRHKPGPLIGTGAQDCFSKLRVGNVAYPVNRRDFSH